MRTPPSRLPVVVLAALAGLAALAASTAVAAPATSLTITWWPREGTAPPRARATLTCGPAGGTLPRPATACGRLAAAGGAAAFAPVPPGVACTAIAGEPDHMIVSGVVEGRRVWAHFRNTDGCQIPRYRKVAFLVPLT
jgi:hypothetical protein